MWSLEVHPSAAQWCMYSGSLPKHCLTWSSWVFLANWRGTCEKCNDALSSCGAKSFVGSRRTKPNQTKPCSDFRPRVARIDRFPDWAMPSRSLEISCPGPASPGRQPIFVDFLKQHQKKKYQIANKYMDYMGGIIWAHLNLTILILGWHVREPTQPHVGKPALILQQQPNLLWHCIMSYHLFRVLSMALPVGAISTREAWKSSFPGARGTAVLLLTVQDQSVKRRMTQVPSTEAGCFEESDVPSFATSDHRILWGCFAPWNLHTRRSRSEITKKAAWKFVGY